MVINEIQFKSAPQRRFVEHDEVVQTFPSDGSDQALHIGIGLSPQLHRMETMKHDVSE